MNRMTTTRFITSWLFLFPLICMAQQDRESDSLALVALYNSTNGINWNLNLPMDTWYGIDIDSDRINKLRLPGNQLTGNIPPEIGNLTKLVSLILTDNQLSGNIPTEIDSLINLKFLYLNNNQFSGDILSKIGGLISVEKIHLSNNQFTDNIPSDIGNLTNLRELRIGTNQFTDNIVPEIWNLTNLEILNLGDNQLNGNIPSQIENLTKLKILNLSDNQLNGNIPSQIDSLINLESLYLDNNQFSGDILSKIENLTNLQALFLQNNQFSGNIPSEIGVLTSLKKIYLFNNQFTGNIPPEIGNLTNLIEFQISANQFTGNIPTSIGNLINLERLALRHNQLSGSIPPEIGHLENLKWLRLSSNDLSDTIPNLENLTQLELLHLAYNNLSGSITHLTNLNNLKELKLSGNRFSGDIPDFSALPDSTILYLDRNKFSLDALEATYLTNSSFIDFRYSPQYHGNSQAYVQDFGDSLTFTLSEPLPGNNNQNISYQWKKNSRRIVGSTDATYAISDLQLSKIGKYTLHMTDSTDVPDLEIISEPIYVIVPGYDLHGQPVVYNQIMMEFDDAADKLDYETEYLHPNAGFVADSCNCNRELYLWQFPSDTAALEVLLAVNTERESIGRRKARVDGGLNNIFNLGPMVSGEGWTWGGDYTESYPDSVLVFLLDSGLDTANWDASSHLLDDAPVDGCYNAPMSSGFDYTDSLTTINGNFTDSLGHGTYGFRSITEGLGDHINLKVVPLKAFDKEGAGTLFNFVCALYHAIDHDADIIHVSAGYTGGASDILENAIALSKEKGCLLVTAAGNDGTDIDSIPQYPAYYAKEFYKEGYNGNDSLVHYNNVISVASIGSQDELSAFSNYGNEAVVMSAYGEDMSGYAHTGEKISSSGSSVSAFYVTRELAVEIAQNSNRTYEQIWQDFEVNCLRDCPATANLTKTGKSLNINLNEVYADLRVYLEGAYDTIAHKMHSDLNMMHLLPGQIIGDSTLSHELAVQPYSAIPPYYQGDEAVPNMFSNYPDNVVDWILISLRAQKSADTELSRTAAWLLESGDVQLLKPLLEDIHTAPDSAFVVIEHRNHLWTMSPQKIPVNRNIITWDFTTQDGYTNPSATGQIQIQSGVWTMLAGDSEQDDIGGGDINGSDKIIWQDNNGSFSLYLKGDYNLNGDANGEDKIFWERNNGKFSGIPK